jgi:signal transduction histidine kinase
MASIAALVVLAAGGSVWWSNPERRVNRAILWCSLAIAAWLACLHVATGIYGAANPAPAGLFWLRLSCAVGAFVPVTFVVVRNSIIGSDALSRPSDLGRTLGLWMVLAFTLAALCFTDSFIPSSSSPLHRVRGWGYYAYIGGVVLLNLVVLVRTLTSLRHVEGVRRLELEVWLIGGCSMQLIIIVAMTLNLFIHSRQLIVLQPVVVLLFYTCTAYAITTYRIFEAGQIIRLTLRWLIAVAAGALVGGAVFFSFYRLLSTPAAFMLAAVVMLVSDHFIGSWLDKRFDLFPQANAARRAAFEVSTQEVRLDHIERRFSQILMGWGQAESALVISTVSDQPLLDALLLTEDNPALRTLERIAWVTPERLAREKHTEGRLELAQLLAQQRLGVAIMLRAPSSVLVCGVGVPASRRPFAYPQVMQLLELGAIFQGPLERAHLAEKMQHAEQLATVGMLGASLAHEIRNPLVSLKAFVQLLPTRYHEQAFRDKFFVLMTDEVKRIDRLTEQLLDLASPHAYIAEPTGLNSVIRAGLELVSPRAAEADVAIRLNLAAEPDQVLTDPAAVKQVLLNLCLNAIQVLEGKAERWLCVQTAAGPGVVELIVSDSGPGIAPEMRSKLFQPFHSSKSSGFGLGLAICRDILRGLDASIEAVESKAGTGAIFRVVFPCPR